MKKSKIYFVALDGAADHKISELGNKTPLEAANTKYLDQIVHKGQMSLINILSNGLSPETDSGIMALLGYEPEKYYCGRGILECLGLETYKQYRYFTGFRINFASIDYEKGRLDRRTARDISSEELQSFTEEIIKRISLERFKDVHFELKTFGKYRGILTFYSNSQKFSGNVSNTDPGFNKYGNFGIPVKKYEMKVKKCVPFDDTCEALVTASIVNDFTEQCAKILKESSLNLSRIKKGKMPVNCVLIRDGGKLPEEYPLFYDKYSLNLSIYGQLPCEKAMSELIGGKFYYTRAFELQLDGNYLSELAEKLKKDEADVIFCHLKGPDEPGHDDKPFEKKRAIEVIDENFFSRLWDADSNNIYIVSCDHATPCELGMHSKDPVPLVIAGEKIVPDNTTHFDENNALLGKCPVDRAVDILDYIVTEKFNV